MIAPTENSTDAENALSQAAGQEGSGPTLLEDSYDYYDEEGEWYGVNMIEETSDRGMSVRCYPVLNDGAPNTLCVIESGASVTVCGSEWIDKWLPKNTA